MKYVFRKPEQAAAKIADFNVVFVEGAFAAGKTTFIKNHCSGWPLYTCSGFTDRLPESLAVDQAMVWLLDVIAQTKLKVLCMRSMLAMLPDSGNLLQQWLSWLEDANACVLMIAPEERVHRRRIILKGQSARSIGIMSEQRSLVAAAQHVTPARLLWLSEIA